MRKKNHLKRKGVEGDFFYPKIGVTSMVNDDDYIRTLKAKDLELIRISKADPKRKAEVPKKCISCVWRSGARVCLFPECVEGKL